MNDTLTKMKKPEKPEYKGTKCPDHGYNCLDKRIYDYDTGEEICGISGLVLHEQMMDKGPEWRAFTQEEKAKRSRVGIPTSYSVHDKGLSTAIGRVDRDAFGRQLPLSTRLQYWRLRKWQIRSRVHDSVDRNLAQAMGELGRLSEKLYIPGPVKERAAVIYRKALEKGLIRGRKISAVAAAALHAACRYTETPRTLKEIAEASLVDKKDVARSYRLLLKVLEMQMPVADPLTYISKIAEPNGISGETQGLAIKILRDARQKRVISGKGPQGIAAAALYSACLQNSEKKVQKDIAEAAGVTDVTLRNGLRELERRGIIPKIS